MSQKHEFVRLYSNVSGSLSAALANISSLDVNHEQGKAQISGILNTLNEIQSRFNSELDFLDKNSEWEKFTMAFFGETNAGKSTIIDSLRILFKESERQRLIDKNEYDLKKFEMELEAAANRVREGLSATYAAYAAEIGQVTQDVAAVAGIVREESSARIRSRVIFAAVSGAFVGAGTTALAIWLFGG